MGLPTKGYPVKRKTEMMSARIDQWMIEGIELSLADKEINRTEWLKNVIAEALRKQGITQASVYARRKD